MRSLELSADALADLRDIWLAAADRDPGAANRVLAEINTVIDRLRHLPGTGHIRRDITDLDYRFAKAGHYQIIYRYDATTVAVARVLHSSRDIGPLLPVP